MSTSHEVPQLIELSAFAAARIVETERNDLAAVRRLLAAGTGSLGAPAQGIHPRRRPADDRQVRLEPDEIDVIAWEKVRLDLAQAASIPVPTSRLISIGGSSALLLDRFDRTNDGHRVPYLSAYALCDTPDPASGDYLEIGDALTELDIADRPTTLRAPWRQYCHPRQASRPCGCRSGEPQTH